MHDKINILNGEVDSLKKGHGQIYLLYRNTINRVFGYAAYNMLIIIHIIERSKKELDSEKRTIGNLNNHVSRLTGDIQVCKNDKETGLFYSE